MRTYEALYIVQPDLADEEIQTVTDQTEKLVTDNGGVIVRSEAWGKRRLAYEVKHYNEGYYVLLRFQSNPEFIKDLERYFRLSDHIIRDLVVYFDENTLKLEAEQLRRKEEEIQAGAERRGRGRDDDDDDDDDRPRRRRGRDRDDDEDDE